MTKMSPDVCRNIGGKWQGGECKPPEGKLLVRRDGFRRGPYTRSDGTKVAGANVPTTYMIIKDVGAKGRGPKIIKIEQKGTLTRYGYSIKKPASERHRAINKAVNRYGAKVVYHKLTAMANLREKAGVAGAHPRRGKEKEWSTFRADRNYVKNKFHPNLKPTKAIAKWKGMSHKARVASRR
jgi:hypothetical protein